ncbi:DnaJ domain-containing protein [Porticoccus sp. W117]|uniref:DnaJ domain-containing protein n=1 Tax=Porticoccus sp. W117 TaxID=3054777 RepID=UPI002598A264|nr:DnaJ domain-containing protein [Porticoccus sp. W117]MDM3871840.1 DnaJ domain-containing protein [Porticoccus sp. W117]
MNIKDAAKILGLSGEVSPEAIKKAYRVAAMKYHPDRNPAGAEMMKIINAAFDALKDYCGEIPEGEAGETTQDYPEAVNNALNAIMGLAGLDIEICGAWVWVSGETYKHKAALKEAGYKFASKKKSWYFRPEDWRSASRGSYSMEKIRGKYGSSKPAPMRRNELESHRASS